MLFWNSLFVVEPNFHKLIPLFFRRWLISHGLRLAALNTLEAPEVERAFGDVVNCALARGKSQAIEELCESKLLEIPATQVPGYDAHAYEELVVAMNRLKVLELPHIGMMERD